MFKPIANGTNPRIVVIAVKRTGLKRALPAFTILSYKFLIFIKLFKRYSQSLIIFEN